MKKINKFILILTAILFSMCLSISCIADSVVLQPVFKDVFLQLYQQVGVITFDKALAFIGINYNVESTTPSDDDLGTIVVEDGSDMYIYMSFYPDETEKDTLSLITYGNTNYEISANDSYHLKSVIYKTYAVDREPKSIEVSTIQELTDFITIDASAREQAYGESIESLSEINVELAVEPIIDNDGKVSFLITTNLPDNAVLMLTLSNGSSEGQTKVTILDGTAISEPFSNKGSALKGKYTLSVSMSIPKLQDSTVTSIIGINGEFLVGDLVEWDDFFECNIVDAEFTMKF